MWAMTEHECLETQEWRDAFPMDHQGMEELAVSVVVAAMYLERLLALTRGIGDGQVVIKKLLGGLTVVQHEMVQLDTLFLLHHK